MIIQKECLSKELLKIYDFGYFVGDKTDKQIQEMFDKSLKKFVLDRIGLIYQLANYFVIEENYVETEWKEMIAKHYIHSAYASSLKQRVIRIHFLYDNSFCEKNYLGFITLRPIEELAISLSFIYVNWNHNLFSNNTSFVMTYSKDVHYKGKKITIQTYPFFAQDSIVTCCADANLIMLSKYFSNKYGVLFQGKTDSAFSNNSKMHQLPKKISLNLLQKMLTEVGISYRTLNYFDADKMNAKNWNEIQMYIDAYIESGLPVILSLDGHVVQLIGHLGVEKDDNKEYIVYDDSGHLEKICNGSAENNKHSFAYSFSIKQIKNYIQKEKITKFSLLMSEHERIYIDFKRYQIYLFEHLRGYAQLDENKSTILSTIFDDENLSDKVLLRNIIVDNSLLKEFLSEQKTAEQESQILALLNHNLPHYLWYTEISIDNKSFCISADPTMYYDTLDLEKLFLHTSPIGILEGMSMTLLTKARY